LHHLYQEGREGGREGWLGERIFEAQHFLPHPSSLPLSLTPSLPYFLPTFQLVAQRPPLLLFEVFQEALPFGAHFPTLSRPEQEEGVVREAPDRRGQERKGTFRYAHGNVKEGRSGRGHSDMHMGM